MNSAVLEEELKQAKADLQNSTEQKESLKGNITAASAEHEKLLEALGNSQQVVLKISNDFTDLLTKVYLLSLWIYSFSPFFNPFWLIYLQLY